METEKEFANKVVAVLSKYFYIQDEKWNDTHKHRIDYILTDMQNDKVHFGIEFKRYDHKRGEDIGSHILQAFLYSLQKFEINQGCFERIPILICPPLSYNYLLCPVLESKILKKNIYNRTVEYFHDRHDKYHEHHTINGILGSFCLGEIRTILQRNKQKIIFSFSNKIVWSNKMKYDQIKERYTGIAGIHEKNYQDLIKKISNFKMP